VSALAVAQRTDEAQALTAPERLEVLCDPGSLQVIRSTVTSRHMGARTRAGDGVVGGSGCVDGRPVFCYAQDGTYVGGSLGEAHAETIVRVLQLARRAGVPVVGFVGSGGARMQEGLAALGGYGRIFRETVLMSGKVPQISIITGLSAGGGAYSPALTDWTVMTRDSSMFLTGPNVVRDALGEQITADRLGGPRVHERNGVCHFVADTDLEGAGLARELLSYLPARAGESARLRMPEPALGGDPGEFVPEAARRVYDMREVIRCMTDGAAFLEVASGWARSIVTGFARLEGRTVGIIANQPRYLGGVLDAASSQKGARFVSKCNAFGIPLVVLVDTPGYMPGSRQESAGVIRFGASLVHAFAEATVPRVTVILRKAFGGAFITMNSKDLGADYVFAWPQAEIGVMGARPAVGIIHRRKLQADDADDGLRDRLVAEYEDTHLRPEIAARDGFVDELIEPFETRDRLAGALGTLCGSGL
jgi:methylmalonyl-CoA decarboxylase subunit alpha